MKRDFIIGTRGSKLALWQAHEVKRQLEQALPQIHVDIRVITTRGDQRLDVALHSNTLSKGLFTEELEQALFAHEIDFAVHSLKDLPVEMDERLQISAVLERADVRDVVLANTPVKSIDDLRGITIGTSSPRRMAQITKALAGQVTFATIRGNVDTRIAKLRRGEYDAIIMAAAGLHRLELQKEIAYYLPLELVLPAPGQAAVAIQTSCDNPDAIKAAEAINHNDTLQATTIERKLLSLLGGGCALPFGCHVEQRNGKCYGSAFFAPQEHKEQRVDFVYTNDSDLIDTAHTLQS